MKLYLVLITVFLCFNSVNAQNRPLDIARSNRLSNITLKELLKDTLNVYLNRPRSVDNMPIGNVGSSRQIFAFNNGRGLNIYKSQPDNMPVAKPDGSYVDNMIAKSTAPNTMADDVIDKLKNNRFEPKGNSKYNFLMPSYKDSLPFVDSASRTLLKSKF
jgi:hypothetical protein